jgi:transposase
MSKTAAQPGTTPIPVQLSEPEFTAFILPHLSMPKRGPKCKLGYYRVFNFILWVLYTGMQWKCLPIPQDAHGIPAIPSTTVDKVFARWADARSGGRVWPVCGISQPRSRSLAAYSMATGPTPWPKKGRWDGCLGGQTPAGRAGHGAHRPSWLGVSSRPRGSRP